MAGYVGLRLMLGLRGWTDGYAEAVNLPVEPGVRDGRDALIRWAVLLEEVIP